MEDDLTVQYTKTVRWDTNANMTPLANEETIQKYVDIYNYEDPGDHDYTPEPLLPELIDVEDSDATSMYVNTFGDIPLSLSTTIKSNHDQKMALIAEYSTYCPPNMPLTPEETMYCHIAMVSGVPVSYSQAMKSTEKLLWIDAMQMEIEKMKKRKSFLPRKTAQRQLDKKCGKKPVGF